MEGGRKVRVGCGVGVVGGGGVVKVLGGVEVGPPVSPQPSHTCDSRLIPLCLFILFPFS